MSEEEKNGRPSLDNHPDLYDPWNRAGGATLHIPQPPDTSKPSPFAQRAALEALKRTARPN